MNSNEKRWVVLLIAVLIIAVVLIVVLAMTNKNDTTVQNEVANEEKYTTELEGGSKLNTSDALNAAKTYGDLEIFNTLQLMELALY